MSEVFKFVFGYVGGIVVLLNFLYPRCDLPRFRGRRAEPRGHLEVALRAWRLRSSGAPLRRGQGHLEPGIISCRFKDWL